MPPIEPLLLTAMIGHGGKRYSLCCVRNHYAGEGDAIFEQLSGADAPNGEPECTHYMALGRWYIRPRDGGSKLLLEFDSVADIEDEAPVAKLLNALLQRIEHRRLGASGVVLIEADAQGAA
jgi:hypothetical protein